MEFRKLTPSREILTVFDTFKNNFFYAVEKFRTAEVSESESEELRDIVLEIWNNEGQSIIEKINKNLNAINDTKLYFAIISMYNNKLRYVVDCEAYDNMIDYILDIPKELHYKLLIEGFIQTEIKSNGYANGKYNNSRITLKNPTKKLGFCYI